MQKIRYMRAMLGLKIVGISLRIISRKLSVAQKEVLSSKLNELIRTIEKRAKM